MKAKDFDFENGAKNLVRYLGVVPGEVRIYTICKSVAISGMSGVIRAFIIKDNRPFYLGEGRVHGCGLNRGHEAAYNMFCFAYPSFRYQDHLAHEWV